MNQKQEDGKDGHMYIQLIIYSFKTSTVFISRYLRKVFWFNWPNTLILLLIFLFQTIPPLCVKIILLFVIMFNTVNLIRKYLILKYGQLILSLKMKHNAFYFQIPKKQQTFIFSVFIISSKQMKLLRLYKQLSLKEQ